MVTPMQDVLNVVRDNGIEECMLVGHSFAGKVAAAVANRAPEKVRRVIYLDAFRPEKVQETGRGDSTPRASSDPRLPAVLQFH